MSHFNEGFFSSEPEANSVPDKNARPSVIRPAVVLPGKIPSMVSNRGSFSERRSKVQSQEYLPHANRSVTHPTTNNETMLHLMKGSLGTGILAMPLAFYHAGWAIGIAGTIIVGGICTYCIHLLVKGQYELAKRRELPSLTYQETAIMALEEGPRVARAIAPYAGYIVNIFLLAYQLGTCCVYVVFVAKNVKSVVDEYTSPPQDDRLYMLCFLLPLILINWVRNLKYLGPVSTLGNLLTFIGFGITLYYMFREGISFEGKQPVGHVRDMPLFFGTVLFALEAIGVIMPLENNMMHPASFVGVFGVLNKSMFVIILLYVGVGLFGYLRWGDEVMGSITLNLPKDEILAQVVKIMLALAIFLSHSLQCYVAIDITWNGYLRDKLNDNKYQIVYEYLVRTLLVLITFGFAVAVPNLELFISLIGALCLSALGIAFPAVIESMIFWYQLKDEDPLGFYAMSFKNTALFIFALFGLIVGTYMSMSEIIATFT